MGWEIAGLGNALIDALVVIEDDSILDELQLTRGTMHPVDHEKWQRAYERVRLHKVTFDSGGSCANTIATCGVLGTKAIYCGQVGDDQMGKMYAAALEAACGAHALQTTNAHHTGKCLSIISGTDAERTMLTDLGASVHLPGLGDFAGILGQAKVAHFTGYTLLPGPMQAVVQEAMSVAKKGGAAVSLDAADPFVVATIKDLLWQVLSDHTDLVFLNAEEARMLTDRKPEEAAQVIFDKSGVRTIIVKLGGQGSMVLHDGQIERVGIRRVKAVDTTGAGDSYAGGFLHGFVNGWSALDCARLATAVAGMTVAQVGAVVKDRAMLADLVREVRGTDAIASHG